MKRFFCGGGLALLLGLGGCKVASLSSMQPPVSVNPFGGAAGTAWPLPVAAAKWANTPPSFGPYRVSELRRGWPSTRRYATPLRAGATGSPVLDVLALPYAQLQTDESNKSQFHFADSLGHAAEVYASSRASTQAVGVLLPSGGQLSQVQKSAVTYSAIMAGPQIGPTNAWNLLLSFPDQLRLAPDPTATIGLVGDDEQVLFRVRLTPHPPLTGRDGRAMPWPTNAGPGGIELLHQSQRVAYVDFATARPAVWLRSDLAPEIRFLAATTLSAILLRTGW